MRTRWTFAAGALALALGMTSSAQTPEATPTREVAAIRLLPPMPQPRAARAPGSSAIDVTGALRIIRERHPQVLDAPSRAGRHVVTLLLRADGQVERSEARHSDGAGFEPPSGPSQDAPTFSMIILQKGKPLPDGTTLNTDLLLQLAILPQGFDPSRSLSRVHDIVRQRHADLLLPVSGGLLNRLTIFLDEQGQIVRENVEQSRFDALRRAPLEDEHFAERIADRVARTLSMDAALIGVVGFTYVEEGSAGFAAADRRTVLVQYAWPRKPGDLGPSMPMAAQAQQQPQVFDTAAALALAEHYFGGAFSQPESAAGTPTIVLNLQGEVLRTGLVQYRSGEIHEVSLQQQLAPGTTLARLISPTLRNPAGASAVVTFAWVSRTDR